MSSLENCPICKEDFDQINMIALPCLHKLCKNCYPEFIKIFHNCCICRFEFREKDEDEYDDDEDIPDLEPLDTNPIPQSNNLRIRILPFISTFSSIDDYYSLYYPSSWTIEMYNHLQNINNTSSYEESNFETINN